MKEKRENEKEEMSERLSRNVQNNTQTHEVPMVNRDVNVGPTTHVDHGLDTFTEPMAANDGIGGFSSF